MHLLGWKVYFWTNKLHGNSGQLCCLDSGKCWIRAIGNLAPSLTGVIIFCNTFYVLESTYTCLLSFSHRTPCPKTRKNGTFGSDLLQSLQFLLFHIWEMVARYWIRPPDFKFESLLLFLWWHTVWSYRASSEYWKVGPFHHNTLYTKCRILKGEYGGTHSYHCASKD